jgi:hypothetical protein
MQEEKARARLASFFPAKRPGSGLIGHRESGGGSDSELRGRSDRHFQRLGQARGRARIPLRKTTQGPLKFWLRGFQGNQV